MADSTACDALDDCLQPQTMVASSALRDRLGTVLARRARGQLSISTAANAERCRATTISRTKSDDARRADAGAAGTAGAGRRCRVADCATPGGDARGIFCHAVRVWREGGRPSREDGRLHARVDDLHGRMGGLHARVDDLHGRMDSLRDELRTEMHGIRDELRTETHGIRDELLAEIRLGDQATRDFMRMIFEHHQSNLRTIGEGTPRKGRKR